MKRTRQKSRKAEEPLTTQYGEGDIVGNLIEDAGTTKEKLWINDPGQFDTTEAFINTLEEDHRSEFLAAYEPYMFTDSAELARVLQEVWKEESLNKNNHGTQDGRFAFLLIMTPDELYKAFSSLKHQSPLIKAVPRRPWLAYFPFTNGTKLIVQYETPIYNWNLGRATVHENASDFLRFELHFDAWDSLNIPQTDAVITIEYKKEGAGNRASIVVNDEPYSSQNVTIHSTRNAREIYMPITILGQRVEKVAFARVAPDETRLTFKTDVIEHVLLLSEGDHES